MTVRLLLDLADAVGRVADGRTVKVPVETDDGAALAARWCEKTGHTFLTWRGDHVELRRGRTAEPTDEIPAAEWPARRLWLYANFDCNLACSYCCVSSSPRTPRRELGLELVRQIVAEAPAVGARELYVTGGEPFLLPDIADVLRACADVLPTTVLTNAMLFRRLRLAALEALPRDGVTLQISLDSATAELHDRQRGAGSHARALAGIATALDLGFRVRIAATLDGGQGAEERDLHELCDRLGIPLTDRLIRRIAMEGAATTGLVITRESLVPEICLTADGVYWHPVGATDPTMLVTTQLLPLSQAVDAVVLEYQGYRRRHDEVALSFPCA